MRSLFPVLTLVFSTALSAAAATDYDSIFPKVTIDPNPEAFRFKFDFPDPFNGDPIPSNVENWIRLTICCAMNHPFPMVWFSTQKFERRYQQSLIVLTPAEYRSFLDFTNSYACPSPTRRFPDVLAIREFSAGEVHEVCAMSPRDGCVFLSKMRMLRDIDWIRPDVDSKPLQWLKEEICALVEHPISGPPEMPVPME